MQVVIHVPCNVIILKIMFYFLCIISCSWRYKLYFLQGENIIFATVNDSKIYNLVFRPEILYFEDRNPTYYIYLNACRNSILEARIIFQTIAVYCILKKLLLKDIGNKKEVPFISMYFT